MSDKDEIEKDWRAELTPEQYRVCREHGTEPAFTGAYWATKDTGTYHCRCCGEALFSSNHKFDSGTGWPSFWQPSATDVIEEDRDDRHGMVRTEVHCRRCAAHLGHVFHDGPEPTGLRYCINSVSLQFSGDEAEP